MGIVVRRPTAADHENLLDFSESLWGALSRNKFGDRWWWHDGTPHCWIAEDENSGEIAATVSARRLRFAAGPLERDATFIGDWYVSPRFAGRGLGRDLVMKCHEESDISYSIAFSPVASKSFERMGWVVPVRRTMHLGLVPVVLALSRGPDSTISLTCSAVSDSEPGELGAVDAIWEKVRWPRRAMMVRDAASLRTHLALAGQRTYSLLLAYRAQDPVGYMLLRVLPAGELGMLRRWKVGCIVDYLVDRDDVKSLEFLVRRSATLLAKRRVHFMVCLASDPSHKKLFSRLGMVQPFSVAGTVLGSGLGVESSYWTAHGEIDSDSNWHLTFADGDLDLGLGYEMVSPAQSK